MDEKQQHFEETATRVLDTWKGMNSEYAEWRKLFILRELDLHKELIGWSAAIVGVSVTVFVNSSTPIISRQFLTASVIVLLLNAFFGVIFFKWILRNTDKRLAKTVDDNNKVFTDALTLARDGTVVDEPDVETVKRSGKISDRLQSVISQKVGSDSLEKILEATFLLFFFVGLVLLALSLLLK